MGQGQSADAPPPTLEQLSHELTKRFASKCFTPIEIYSFSAVFKSLAETSSGVRHWNEATLCRFLGLPDELAVGSVVFQMATYLGAFPFPSQAPAILTLDNLLKVVTLLTRRHTPVLGRRGDAVWVAEVYRSLAVYDRGLDAVPEDKKPAAGEEGGEGAEEAEGGEGEAAESSTYTGFAVDEPVDGDESDEEGDELVLAALDSMDVAEVFKQGEQPHLHHSVIPTDNFLRLLQLLLLIAPLEAQDNLSEYFAQVDDERLRGLRATANNILSSFDVDKNHGVNFKTFNAVVTSSMPYLFDGLSPLFEHFLFAKELDLSKRKESTSSAASGGSDKKPASPPPVREIPSSAKQLPAPEPILQSAGEILDLNMLSQLSFMIKGTNLFRRLRPLYSGGEHGFSMGSFEKSVFNWRAPSILLVSGTLLPDTPSNPSERAFADSLPPKRLPSSLDFPSGTGMPQETQREQALVFGAYIPTPWKNTPKTAFGDSSTQLFQLAPAHDVFAASALASDYAYFNKPPHGHTGLGLGSGVPSAKAAHQYGASATVPLGAVSLHVDAGLEFAVFTHFSEGGGSFRPSRNPARAGRDWQDRFAIEAVEVWGCGGDEEAEAQRKAWAWEEREAEARRKINLGTGDIEADRELLRLAGLIGGDRSGGSMG
ncbi:uncharacterized protein K452DRAFT_272850 [Aplosporella prunicola CBS 121167]|uniref:Restriction of telomere capping protein 5 n=1 Tax=Aplosporella prunicola CBS 121167 TaxID=1176127 RepID=A0A6A6B9T5_9PEZI|nr:uncharacterized protein K452DRAFT_272850 [Aplosporella prunicola CBS 121167]KAF2141032.1 hypothetical protein K452DRAFT_272850 [Aplosporella prunicola CBS 121167]